MATDTHKGGLWALMTVRNSETQDPTMVFWRPVTVGSLAWIDIRPSETSPMDEWELSARCMAGCRFTDICDDFSAQWLGREEEEEEEEEKLDAENRQEDLPRYSRIGVGHARADEFLVKDGRSAKFRDSSSCLRC
ncbi:hypothetical protein PVAG01_04648 [Phlyctema vagabunda]|uniref:Uncharacterized protein n=1 Tax=Phlyctema vagabunda TaxID=108571 RepID=A0ABR4PIS4_9HELO